MKNRIKNYFATFGNTIWSLFVSGLLTLLPITLTIAIFNVSFKILKGWLAPIRNFEPELLRAIPFSELFLVLIFIVLIGIVLKVFILQTLIHALERIVFKMPLVRTLYSGIKQLVHAFNPQDKVSFKRVVLIEFPRQGIYSVGFLTSELPEELSPEKSKAYFNIFVPTTPNPTTGFFFMVSREHFLETQLSRQEAMALIISGGIIQPERFTKSQESTTRTTL